MQCRREDIVVRLFCVLMIAWKRVLSIAVKEPIFVGI